MTRATSLHVIEYRLSTGETMVFEERTARLMGRKAKRSEVVPLDADSHTQNGVKDEDGRNKKKKMPANMRSRLPSKNSLILLES